MVISQNKNIYYSAQIPNYSKKTAAEEQKKQALENNTIIAPDTLNINTNKLSDKDKPGNFDTFVNMINEETQAELEAKNKEIEVQVTALGKAGVDWEFEYAYKQLKSVCEAALKYETDNKKTFSSLKEEKEYYSKLKKDNIAKLDKDGEFTLSSYKKGDMLNSQELEKAIEDVQARIDELISDTAKYYDKASKAYEIAGTAMIQVAGGAAEQFKGALQPIKSQLPYIEGYSALGKTGDLYAFSGVERNEENFLDYSDRTYKDIEGKLDMLEKLKKEYVMNKPDFHIQDNRSLNELLMKLEELEENKHTVSEFYAND